MRYLLPFCAVALTATSSPALASETPRYEPAPSWAIPAPSPKSGGSALPIAALLDQQTRIENGTVWSYREIGTRAISADTLARMGTLTLSWQPYHGDLIIHRVDIVRDGQHIDVLKAGQKFSVIRRERNLEQLEMDGTLTATLQVEGMRIGDVIDVAYSVTVKDPALKGGVQANEAVFAEPFKVDFARGRMLWPTGAPVHWKSYTTGLKFDETDSGGWHELSFSLPAPKQAEVPGDAPQRYHAIPAMEASTFADWAAVSSVFAPLYDTRGLIKPGSALAAEVAKIRTAEADPKHRAAAALALVQDRVRYFAAGMNGGNYTPQSPDRTWSAGYGDCKAKTLLLLALLHELGIEAEPILASIGQGGLVEVRLPSPAAFNHILVHATVGGEDLWLDGTGRGSRIEDLADPPPFRTVLPVRDRGASLVQLPTRAPARPTSIVAIDIDESAGLGLGAPFKATATMRGGAGDAIRVLAAQLDNEKLLPFALLSLGGAAGPNAVPVTQKIDYDPSSGATTITVTGIARPAWRRQDHAYRLRPASSISGLTLNSDRSRAAWKEIPVETGAPGHLLVTTRIHLPDGEKIKLEGDNNLDLQVAGRQYTRTASLGGGVLTIEERSKSTGEELASSNLPKERASLAAAQARSLRLTTAPDYPPVYQQVLQAKRDHKLDTLAALHSALIADKPEDANRYVARAQFYEATFQHELALADLDKAVSLDASATTLLRRAALLETLKEKERAAADYEAVLAIDPSSKAALMRLGLLKIDGGRKEVALEPIEQHLAGADEDKPDWLIIKAQLLARAGDAEAAVAATSEALAAKSTSATYLNQRCWIKATLVVQLESATQDCTRAIELSENNASAFDSRALVNYRLNRLSEALADVNAALDRSPTSSASLYLRALIEQKMGDTAKAEQDAASARLLSPRVVEDYARWKLTM